MTVNTHDLAWLGAAALASLGGATLALLSGLWTWTVLAAAAAWLCATCATSDP